VKELTWDGTGTLVIPGHTLAGGKSAKISDKDAQDLVEANPGLPITITDLPAKSGRKRRAGGATPKRRAKSAQSQPEAHAGEGQPIATEPQEE
jgi:hypothetical protein